jgi:hypothetical protein
MAMRAMHAKIDERILTGGVRGFRNRAARRGCRGGDVASPLHSAAKKPAKVRRAGRLFQGLYALHKTQRSPRLRGSANPLPYPGLTPPTLLSVICYLRPSLSIMAAVLDTSPAPAGARDRNLILIKSAVSLSILFLTFYAVNAFAWSNGPAGPAGPAATSRIVSSAERASTSTMLSALFDRNASAPHSRDRLARYSHFRCFFGHGGHLRCHFRNVCLENSPDSRLLVYLHPADVPRWDTFFSTPLYSSNFAQASEQVHVRAVSDRESMPATQHFSDDLHILQSCYNPRNIGHVMCDDVFPAFQLALDFDLLPELRNATLLRKCPCQSKLCVRFSRMYDGLLSHGHVAPYADETFWSKLWSKLWSSSTTKGDKSRLCFKSLATGFAGMRAAQWIDGESNHGNEIYILWRSFAHLHTLTIDATAQSAAYVPTDEMKALSSSDVAEIAALDKPALRLRPNAEELLTILADYQNSASIRVDFSTLCAYVERGLGLLARDAIDFKL